MAIKDNPKFSTWGNWEKGFVYLGCLTAILLVSSRKAADLLGVTLGEVLDKFEVLELMSLIASSPELEPACLLGFIYDN